MDEDYDKFFDFITEEVESMLEYYGVKEKEYELKDWHDGYLFGKEEIYNLWSAINYISRGSIPQVYWVNTGKKEILGDVLKVSTDYIIEKLHDLLQGNKVVAKIDQNVIYKSLTENQENIYSLLLGAAYLKVLRKDLQADGSHLCEVSIPNKEIQATYKNEILTHFLHVRVINRTIANKITKSLYANNCQKLQIAIEEYMDKTTSFFDGGIEGFYHV